VAACRCPQPRALDIPEGTVKTLTHRAVGRLRDSGFVDQEVIDA
jgi:hypothetical protein